VGRTAIPSFISRSASARSASIKFAGDRVHDWGYDIEAGNRIWAARVIEARRGKVLGGSSSINVMA